MAKEISLLGQHEQFFTYLTEMFLCLELILLF